MTGLRFVVRLALTLAFVAVPTLARGQSTDPADDAPVQAGPVALAPTISLTNVGHDSNVYHEAQNPREDVTATVSPAVDAWLRLQRVRVSSRNAVDAIYYRTLTDLRAVDTVNFVRVEALLGRWTPYGTGARSQTRHRRNLEIDAPIRRLDEAFAVGVALQLTGKASINAEAGRTRLKYDGDTLYLGSDLAQILNRTSSSQTVTFRYVLTPLTTVGLDAQWDSDRFASKPERDSDGVRVGPLVEFRPFALVSGRAQIGFRRRTFLNNSAPPFQGTVAHVDLTYTLLGRTQFGVQVDRDVSYSYRLDDEEYVQGSVYGTVRQRLAEPWSVTASVGRYRLLYRGAATNEAETVRTYGAGVGYSIGRTILGAQIDYQQRHSEVTSSRDYDRTRISSSITHTF